MNAKEYLTQYHRLTWKIQKLERDINAAEIEIQNGADTETGKRLIKRLAALKEKKDAERAAAWDKREEITAIIERVDDVILQQLLYNRFVMGMPWECVADDLQRSEYWTRTELKQRAYLEIEKLINDNQSTGQ